MPQVDVIDPEPDFNPEEHERRFPGRYVFHRDISHSVLPQLDPADVALIDGDHNWYTVNGELDCSQHDGARSRRAAPGARPARRRLALRPARPLLRARADPGGVPSAAQARRNAPGNESLLPRGGVNYDLRQRRWWRAVRATA